MGASRTATSQLFQSSRKKNRIVHLLREAGFFGTEPPDIFTDRARGWCGSR